MQHGRQTDQLNFVDSRGQLRLAGDRPCYVRDGHNQEMGEDAERDPHQVLPLVNQRLQWKLHRETSTTMVQPRTIYILYVCVGGGG